MIRLGSLAGYPFEGPRLLGGVDGAGGGGGLRDRLQARTGRQTGPVRGHLRRSLRQPLRRAIPVQAPAASCWVKRAGDRWKVYICTYTVPGGGRSHRELIARELTAIYHPSCNSQQYDRSWKDEWIGEYDAPTTRPLTTSRGPPAPLPTAQERADPVRCCPA